jgi:hypothetical protein
MTQTTVNVETLRDLLEWGQPATILDIRRTQITF